MVFGPHEKFGCTSVFNAARCAALLPERPKGHLEVVVRPKTTQKNPVKSVSGNTDQGDAIS